MEVIHEGKKIMGYNSMKFKIAQQEIKSKNIFQKHKYIYIYMRAIVLSTLMERKR